MALALSARETAGETDGAMARLNLAGAALSLDHRGALLWPDEGLMAVADLHLEKGSAFAMRGQMLPPYDSALTLATLSQLITRHRPRRLILLGDTFHDPHAFNRMEPRFRDSLLALSNMLECIWIAGNHDPETPVELAGPKLAEIAIGPLVFRHEPRAGAQPGEVAGHLHPVARVVTERGRLRRRAFVSDGSRLVMPAFGAYAGGLNLRDPALAGLFGYLPITAHVCGTTRVFAVAEARLFPD
ncbi:MAG: ligase-associated DNA damage response endonuclease PdeM [Beijerinckiaceae bacterium]